MKNPQKLDKLLIWVYTIMWKLFEKGGNKEWKSKESLRKELN